MPRTARVAPGGMVFHVLNRGVARMQLFEKAADYQAFEQVLQDTLDQSPMRICAYAVMPNHWHLLLWPECDGELSAFMQRLTITHVRRWQEHRGYAGLGHVYQGRYKSFPVESDEHFWVVARSVERNALRANLVLRAEEWRWSSLWQRCHPTGEERSLLAAWPIDMPANWLERVNQTDNAQELEALRRSGQRGRPFGQPEWQKEIAKRLGLESAYRPTGRPRRVGRNQKCLARVKIARTSAGPPSSIGPVLLFATGPVPLSATARRMSRGFARSRSIVVCQMLDLLRSIASNPSIESQVGPRPDRTVQIETRSLVRSSSSSAASTLSTRCLFHAFATCANACWLRMVLPIP